MDMFFTSWYALLRILVVGVLAYIGLVLFQRITGKRTLSKLNAFDLIVTIAFGSALASVITSKTVALSEGLLAFGLLMVLQYSVTWLSVRSETMSNLVKSEPHMLFYDGQFLQDEMKKQRVVEAEIRQAVRSSGKASLDDVLAVVIETDGSFSVIGRGEESESALSDVRRPDGMQD